MNMVLIRLKEKEDDNVVNNGDQAARRPHTMCSICGRWFTTHLFGVCGDRDELIRYLAHVFLLAPYWHMIWSICNRLVAISKGDFLTPRFGGTREVGDGPIQ